ncbi:MAG TPA: tetratricopeptide repeat protein [Rhizomicrobium sp.]|nr:tetratricopeptide repeat protein [Rhizomicrobium sp.]
MHDRRVLCAVAFCLMVSTAGCASAQSGKELAATFDSGVAAYDAGDYQKAFKIWSSIQDQDLAAMRNVAMMLRKGQGTAKDPEKAEEIYEVAAEAGLPTAQADLADMLLKGEAGKPDPKRALPLLEAAAAANHPIAQYELAQMFETGQDGLVPKDLTVARRLYAAAAGHGMKEAATRLDALGGPLPEPPPGAPKAAPGAPAASAATLKPSTGP